MDMLEKASRSLAKLADDDFEANRDFWTAHARVVIEAITDPDEAMLHAADGMTDLVGPYPEANTAEERRKEFACAWHSMIRSILDRP